MKHFASIILLLLSFQTSIAQTPSKEKHNSIEGIITEFLDQITIVKGEKMDTSLIRNLFIPSAQFAILNHGDSSYVETVSLDEFLILLMDPYYEEGYEEREISKVVDEYNGIAQVFQSFYGKDSEGNEERGITSYQLVKVDNRWWIVNLLWTLESDNLKIPDKYIDDN
ncbi:hypothetical protein [Marinigracilibium pacificum]|uniref:Nuclear transport factor 2 family protein n=1 Tax=Marinigracilibium pacificum TaxID=2729599 RepID=A0A848IWR4_9BACT|nr:hypothetical protein [Marinigracilibium pacificum]NMM47721.1 hypothetical protein [Marinigracilibium pacificum]